MSICRARCASVAKLSLAHAGRAGDRTPAQETYARVLDTVTRLGGCPTCHTAPARQEPGAARAVLVSAPVHRTIELPEARPAAVETQAAQVSERLVAVGQHLLDALPSGDARAEQAAKDYLAVVEEVSADGSPAALRTALIWADMRAVDEAQLLIDKVGLAETYRITGHRASSSYSGAKILWIRNHQPDLFRQAHKFLHAKDFVVAERVVRTVGVEEWFELPHRAEPKRSLWHRIVVDVLWVYPVAIISSVFIAPRIARLSMEVRVVISTLLITLVMRMAVGPLRSRLRARRTL